MGAATAQTAFSAMKAAVIQTSRDLGVHLAKSGVRVNSISIGPVETPQSKAMFEKVGAEGLKERLAHVPTGRFADPAEIAGIAAFLASSDSSYLTATDIQADGGIRGAYTIPDFE
jgi:NAD(P)-dependent dehydrogenase (short-subunit alcohol dehydrogenase family)